MKAGRFCKKETYLKLDFMNIKWEVYPRHELRIVRITFRICWLVLLHLLVKKFYILDYLHNAQRVIIYVTYWFSLKHKDTHTISSFFLYQQILMLKYNQTNQEWKNTGNRSWKYHEKVSTELWINYKCLSWIFKCFITIFPFSNVWQLYVYFLDVCVYKHTELMRSNHWKNAGKKIQA